MKGYLYGKDDCWVIGWSCVLRGFSYGWLFLNIEVWIGVGFVFGVLNVLVLFVVGLVLRVGMCDDWFDVVIWI